MFGYNPIAGYVVKVQNYEQVLNGSVPIDGTPTLFMLENEPIFYVVSIQNGQKMINGFEFKAINAVVQKKRIVENEDSAENRISNLEQAIFEIKDYLARSDNNEQSNISNVQPTAVAKDAEDKQS